MTCDTELKCYQTVLFNFTVLIIFVSCPDILVSNVFRVKSTFCEHFLIVQCHGERNRKHNARLVWFGLVV